MIGIITFQAYWHKVGHAIINTVVVVDVDKKLEDIIADELAKKKSTADIVIARDLKSAKSFDGKDVKPLLNHQFSAFNKVIGAEEQKELHVVFNKPMSQQTKPAGTYLDVLMQKAKPIRKSFESKFSVDEVEEFLSGFAEASNKQNYLETYENSNKKPSIIDQHEAYAVAFLNSKNLTYSSGSGGEDDKAKRVMPKLINTVQFLIEHKSTISTNQVRKYESSELLQMSANCIKAKAKAGKKRQVTEKLLRQELSNAEALLHAFPSSWWKTVDKNSEERKGEAILSEVELMRDIIATNIARLVDQQARSQELAKKPPKTPSPFNTESSIIKAHALSGKPMSDEHKNLCEEMKTAAPYTPFQLFDERMNIDEAKLPHQRSKARKKFVENIRFPFKVGVFTFHRPGSPGDWVAVCRLQHGDTEASDGFLGFVAAASREAPLLLSRRQTRDAVSAIAKATGKSKRLSRAIFAASLPDGTLPQFDTLQEETEIFMDITKMILQLQCDEAGAMDAIVDDMRRFNGKADTSKFDVFWKGATEVLENQNGSGAHVRRHAASDEQTTIDVQYAPGILSIPQLVRETEKYLTDEKKLVQGVDFYVPCLSWVYLQLSPNNEFKRTASRYTSKIPFKLMLQTRDARDFSHVCAHWVSGMKKMWRHEISLKYNLILKYMNSRGDDNNDTCLPPQHAIMCLGDDDKASAPVGRTIPVSATGKQSSRAIVQESSRAADHDWHCESLAMTVIHHMNISENPNDSQYSGGKEGTGFVTVSVHDRTLNPSTGLQHSANSYDYILRQAKKRCNADDVDNLETLKRFFPLLLHIETDGGPDHNFTFLRNTMALFGLFLICDVDKLTATRCCPGLSFLNIVERAMSLVNMGISSLSLAIDPNADKFLVDEVIKGMSSMKNVRESISDYDKAMQAAIEIIERQLNKLSVHEESDEESSEEESSASEEESSEGDSSEEMTVAHSSITCKVGDEVVKFFPSYGRFKGRVSRINGDDEDGKFIHIIFEDGEEVDYSQKEVDQEVDEFTALSAIPVGEVGFQFIKRFGTAGYFSGSVIGPRGPDQNGAQHVISGCRRCPTPIGGKFSQIQPKNPCRANVGINMFGI